jgi:hypothetical protein
MAAAMAVRTQAGRTPSRAGPRCSGRAARAVPGIVRGYTPGIPPLAASGNTGITHNALTCSELLDEHWSDVSRMYNVPRPDLLVPAPGSEHPHPGPKSVKCVPENPRPFGPSSGDDSKGRDLARPYLTAIF